MSFSWDFTFVHCSFSFTDSSKSVAREDRAILLNRRMGSFCLRADLRSSVVARHFRLLAGRLSPLSSCDSLFCHRGLCQRGLSPEGSSAFSILFWRLFRRQFAVGSSMYSQISLLVPPCSSNLRVPSLPFCTFPPLWGPQRRASIRQRLGCSCHRGPLVPRLTWSRREVDSLKRPQTTSLPT